jgi:hypothetical protein
MMRILKQIQFSGDGTCVLDDAGLSGRELPKVDAILKTNRGAMSSKTRSGRNRIIRTSTAHTRFDNLKTGCWVARFTCSLSERIATGAGCLGMFIKAGVACFIALHGVIARKKLTQVFQQDPGVGVDELK